MLTIFYSYVWSTQVWLKLHSMKHHLCLFGSLQTNWKYNDPIWDGSFIGKAEHVESSFSEGRDRGLEEHLVSLRKFQVSCSHHRPPEMGPLGNGTLNLPFTPSPVSLHAHWRLRVPEGPPETWSTDQTVILRSNNMFRNKTSGI